MSDFFGGSGSLGDSFASAGTSFLTSIAGTVGSALGGKLGGALGLGGNSGNPPVAGVPYNPPAAPAPVYVAAPAPVAAPTPTWVYVAIGVGGLLFMTVIVIVAKR